jgi:pSer/pThr/pTyr-binding forkhead associated (FHA) protein
MDVKLVMFKRDGQRKDFPITQKVTVLGRGEECGLKMPLPAVSRKHCEILKGGDNLKVRDLASSNGTYVNNKRINETALKAGDRLVIGSVVFTVQLDGRPEKITPVKTRGEKAASGVGRPAAQGEIIELEADIASEAGNAEESDPIAALEAMASEAKKNQPEKKK